MKIPLMSLTVWYLKATEDIQSDSKQLNLVTENYVMRVTVWYLKAIEDIQSDSKQLNLVTENSVNEGNCLVSQGN